MWRRSRRSPTGWRNSKEIGRWLALAATTFIGCSHGAVPEPSRAQSPDTECSPQPVDFPSPSASTSRASARYLTPRAPARSIVPPNDIASVPSLPEGVVPGEEVQLPVPGDRSVIVVHAPAGNRQAIVYLHGVCGDVYAIRSWAGAVSQRGTLVAMLGDDACKARKGRFRWFRDADRLDRRIQRTLEAVAEARGGQLDLEQITLIGYSQGADRAERVASRFSHRYPRVLLGSPPDAPGLRFAEGQAVAVVAGARENNDKRRDGVEALKQAGYPAVFLTLPDAYHGQFGPEGDRVMDEAVAWLFHQTEPSVFHRPLRDATLD